MQRRRTKLLPALSDGARSREPEHDLLPQTAALKEFRLRSSDLLNADPSA